MSFRIKLFIAFVVFGIILTAFTQLLLFKLNEDTIKQESLQRAHNYATHVNKTFLSYINDINAKLNAINSSDTLYVNINKDGKQDLIESLFMDIAKTSKNIMQLRFIDIDGDELVRIDRDNIGTTPYAIQSDDLQNKKNRYYFKEIFRLNEGELWYSKLDLNIEHGKIERPVKPVLRAGTPFYYKGKKIGIIVINVFIQNLLKAITKSEIYNVYILDKDGYVLMGPTDKASWNRYIKSESSDIQSIFQKNRNLILHNTQYFGDGFYSQKLQLHNGEGLTLLVVPNNLKLQNKLQENNRNLIIVFLTVVLLSLPLSYFISLLPAQLKERVDKLNRRLKNESLEKDVLLSLFDHSNSILFKWKNDEKWSVAFVSKNVHSLLGYSKEDFEINGMCYSQCIHSDDLANVKQEFEQAIKNQDYFLKHHPYRVQSKSGEIKWILDQTIIVRNDKNEIINYIGYLLDITKIKEREIELKALARTDQLTRIYNRVYLDEVLHNQHYRFQRNKEICSIILLDIDYFKEVNDHYGHIVGDKILIEFAQLLQNSLRDGDILGRWGGEEFLIVLPHTQKEQAMILAEKLRQIVEDHVFTHVMHKTASFGVCSLGEDITIESLVDNADIALYKAKKSGRNKVVACSLT